MQCERDYIRFSVNTEKPFKGKVFVKGEYTNDQCVRNFAQTATGKLIFRYSYKLTVLY